MPKPVLTRKRSWIARFAVLAVVFSLLAVALPASAHSVAISTSTSCPATTPSAGFTDIGAFDATTQLAINCLVMYGISQGTSATTFEPNLTVSRWQMALFLVRQAADHGLTIPVAANQGYTDISGFPQATQDAINQITQLGISKGTSSTTFSPSLGVTRWQMALFIYRLGLAAGVTFTGDTSHNEFTDISGTLAEAQTAINALADAHIALGVGGSLFAPNLELVRWQMALFLTRLLAADGVLPPAGFRVTVTPTEAATQAGATARAFTATYKNADGTPYTGAVGVTLFAVTSGVVQYDGAPAPNAVIESVSGFTVAAPAGVGTATVTGFPGTDGAVTFVVRHVGAGQTVVAVAWEDLDGDGSPEISGNAAPTEPHGLGGNTTFGSVAAAECPAFGPAAFAVTAVDKAADRFEAGGCSQFYDSNDLFLVSSVPTDLAGFEAALNVGDTVTSTYDPDTADQSTFNITTDTDPDVTITDPAAATAVDANSYAIKGTAVGGYTVAIYIDNVANDGLKTAGEPKVGETTAAADGTWTIVVPLTQNAVNDFVATQRAAPADSDTGTGVQVPLITEGAIVGASFTSTTAANGAAAGILDPGDTIVVVFSEAVSGFGSGDTFAIQDPDLSTVTLTCGGNVSCAIDGTNTTVTITIVNVLVTSGGTAGIQGSFTINSVSGFTTTSNGAAISLSGDRTASGF